MDDLRVAAVQASAVSGDIGANVASAARWVRRSADRGARLVVLPELFLPGYDPVALDEQGASVDVDASDPRLDPLRVAADETSTRVIVGASVRTGGRRRLALLGLSPDPAVLYAKQHLWEAEQAIFTPGTEGATAHLDGWPIGLGICYDGCFPEHARAATDAGALAYVCPSAYLVGSEHRRDLYYAARALDNGIYVVMAGLVGRCGALDFSGGTAIYDPQGRPVARVDGGEGIAVADLDRAVIAEARAVNDYERDRPESLGGRTTTVL